MKTATVFLTLAMVACWGGPAPAEISTTDLARARVRAPADAREPSTLAFRDQDGRDVTLGGVLDGKPGLLVFEDFRCKTLCGPALSIVAAAIAQSGLAPGRDFRLISIDLNPKETPADAKAFELARLSDQRALVTTSAFLTGAPSSISHAAAALGYGYAYDPQSDQFTHPVAAFVLASDGRLTRVLGETAMGGAELRAAVQDAAAGRVGAFIDRLALLCHDLIPLSGRYDAAVQTGLRLAAATTVLAMAAALTLLMKRRRPT